MSDDQDKQPSGEGQPRPTDGERTFTQRDLDHIAAKERRAAQALSKELEEARAKLAAIDEANKTEQQKAIERAAEQARKEAEKEFSVRLAQKEREHKLYQAAARAGVHSDFIPSLEARLRDVEDADKLDEAVSSLVKECPHFVGAKPIPAGVQPGSPGVPSKAAWTPERLQRIAVERGMQGFTEQEWAEIKASGLA